MLGLHQTWTSGTAGAAPLRAGYFTVILADDAALDTRKFWIHNGRLAYGDAAQTAKPLRGYNYMLFRLERRDERDDWDSLQTIQEPYDKQLKCSESETQIRRMHNQVGKSGGVPFQRADSQCGHAA